MTPEVLSSVAAIILSLLFSYWPGLNTWYAAQTEARKKLLMLGMTITVAAGAFALSCGDLLFDLFGVSLACSQESAVALVRAIIWAVVANQSTYMLTPQSQAVTDLKAVRDGLAGAGVGRG